MEGSYTKVGVISGLFGEVSKKRFLPFPYDKYEVSQQLKA